MSSLSTIPQWQGEVQKHLPSLSLPQARVVGLWSYAMVFTKSCGITQVSNWLANVLQCPRGRLRQRLREAEYEASAKRGARRREVKVEECFADLLRWVIQNWQGKHELALALDATTLGERFTVLSISVVYRGCAIPVAWHFLRAKEAGSWQEPLEALLQSLQGAIPVDWKVLVMADRGLYAPWLYRAIQRLGWHPMLRVKEGMSLRAVGEETFRPIGERVVRHGRRWSGRGVWSEQGTPIEGTVLVRWERGYDEKLAVVTDLWVEEAEGAWYQMRFWIEDEFKDEKRGGWRWEQTKMTDPGRASRRWLAMAVAMHWVVLVGGEQEVRQQAEKRRPKAGSKGKVGRPRKQFHRPRGRELSCFVRGQQAISAAVMRGENLPMGTGVGESWPRQVYAVGKPPSSWVKKRKHKEERQRQRKSKQSEQKRREKVQAQAHEAECRAQHKNARAQRTREQEEQRTRHREENAQRVREHEAQRAQRTREKVSRTQEQEHEHERKREARRQRHEEQEQIRAQRQLWHEECARTRYQRQVRTQERVARQAQSFLDPAHPEPSRQANPP